MRTRYLNWPQCLLQRGGPQTTRPTSLRLTTGHCTDAPEAVAWSRASLSSRIMSYWGRFERSSGLRAALVKIHFVTCRTVGSCIWYPAQGITAGPHLVLAVRYVQI